MTLADLLTNRAPISLLGVRSRFDNNRGDSRNMENMEMEMIVKIRRFSFESVNDPGWKALQVEIAERGIHPLEARFLELVTDAGLPWRYCENLIYYSHTGYFRFGWRDPLTQGQVDEIRAVLDTIPNLKGFNVEFKQ